MVDHLGQLFRASGAGSAEEFQSGGLILSGFLILVAALNWLLMAFGFMEAARISLGEREAESTVAIVVPVGILGYVSSVEAWNWRKWGADDPAT